jgi:hypothetical protein
VYPEYISLDKVLSSASSPKEISRAYRTFDARFAVDAEGALSLRLSLDLKEEVGKSLQEERTYWTVATR